jgi:hypothetical protein
LTVRFAVELVIAMLIAAIITFEVAMDCRLSRTLLALARLYVARLRLYVARLLMRLRR